MNCLIKDVSFKVVQGIFRCQVQCISSRGIPVLAKTDTLNFLTSNCNDKSTDFFHENYSHLDIYENKQISLPTVKANIELTKVDPLLLCFFNKVQPIPLNNYKECPSIQYDKKHAARLIVIRRRKMKKHKMKKLLKRTKHLRMKLKHLKTKRKEKEFQDSQLQLIKRAISFDAKTFVQEKLEKARKEAPPDHWLRSPLPLSILQQMEEEAKVKIKKLKEYNEYSKKVRKELGLDK